MRKTLEKLVEEAGKEYSEISTSFIPDKCMNCANGELHGFPRMKVPEWYCFSISFFCPTGKHHDPYGEPCENYVRGEPKKVHDDVDGF